MPLSGANPHDNLSGNPSVRGGLFGGGPSHDASLDGSQDNHGDWSVDEVANRFAGEVGPGPYSWHLGPGGGGPALRGGGWVNPSGGAAGHGRGSKWDMVSSSPAGTRPDPASGGSRTASLGAACSLASGFAGAGPGGPAGGGPAGGVPLSTLHEGSISTSRSDASRESRMDASLGLRLDAQSLFLPSDAGGANTLGGYGGGGSAAAAAAARVAGRTLSLQANRALERMHRY